MPRKPRHSEAAVREAVHGARSFTDALRRLGLRPAGGKHANLRKLVAHYRISTDHFDPYASLRGPRPHRPLTEILVDGNRRREPKSASRKVPRPPYAQLMAEVNSLSMTAVGRKHGVSDNAVRKWIRQYEREPEAKRQSEPPGAV